MAVERKNAKIVMFDFDGTLASPFSRTAWERLWSHLGYPLSDCVKYHKLYSSKAITYEEWFNITQNQFKVKGLTVSNIKEVASQINLLDDAEETIGELRNKGILLFIVSGSVREVISEVLGTLEPNFEDIKANEFVFQDGILSEIIATKYDFEGKAEYVKKIADEYVVSPSEILFIGNSFNDTSVHLAGARTLCINPADTNYKNSIEWHDYIKETSSLKDILPYVFAEGSK